MCPPGQTVPVVGPCSPWSPDWPARPAPILPSALQVILADLFEEMIHLKMSNKMSFSYKVRFGRGMVINTQNLPTVKYYWYWYSTVPYQKVRSYFTKMQGDSLPGLYYLHQCVYTWHVIHWPVNPAGSQPLIHFLHLVLHHQVKQVLPAMPSLMFCSIYPLSERRVLCTFHIKIMPPWMVVPRLYYCYYWYKTMCFPRGIVDKDDDMHTQS